MSSSMRGKRTRQFKSEINVVPYIDVMLVLLVIFMVTAPLTNPGVINLPSAEKSTLPPTEYIQIVLQPNAQATIGVIQQKNGLGPSDPTANRAALIQKLRTLHALRPTLPVMISADRDIKYDDVIQLISEAKKSGIQRVALATKQ